MKKRTFYTEIAYFTGIILLAISAALMAKCDFGLSMVIAPAYILHIKLSEFFPWFSFGMSAYLVQLLIIVILWIVVKKFKPKYLLSFGTAVFYGCMLDLFTWALGFLDISLPVFRILGFVLGMIICGFGVALIFHTYLPPEAYELFVKEVAKKYNFDIGKTKTVYDLSSCIIAIALSFIFFGLFEFRGVHIGTVICALLNGLLISCASKILEKFFSFEDGLPMRRYFE